MTRQQVTLFALIGVGVFLAMATSRVTQNPVSVAVPSVSTPPVPTAAECRQNLSCWAERHAIAAEVRCEKAVERLALHDFAWTTSWAQRKFSRYRWKDRSKGTLTYIGDRIKFQNGFGAWTHSLYECDVYGDGSEVTVLDARARPGRLP